MQHWIWTKVTEQEHLIPKRGTESTAQKFQFMSHSESSHRAISRKELLCSNIKLPRYPKILCLFLETLGAKTDCLCLQNGGLPQLLIWKTTIWKIITQNRQNNGKISFEVFGVAFNVKRWPCYELISHSSNIKCSFSEISIKNVSTLCVFYSPQSLLRNKFLLKLEVLLRLFNSFKRKAVIFGEFNADSLKDDSHQKIINVFNGLCYWIL